MELHVEYMEFYNKQQYYKDLAKNEGYTIIINVDEEDADLENERISIEAAQMMNLLQESRLVMLLFLGTRGTEPEQAASLCDTCSYS